MPKEFHPNTTQEPFILSKARVVGFISGVGSGKTCAGAVKAIMKINDGEDGVIIAPDFPHLAKSTWQEFAKWVPWSKCKNAHLDHPFSQKKMLEFDINGKTVKVFYSGADDPDALTGMNINWAWGDELGRKTTRRVFDVLMARTRIGNNPQLWITSTPRGKNWLYDIFEKGIFDEATTKALKEIGYQGKLVECYHAATEENKDHLDPFFYATLKGMYAGQYAKQELEGAFVSMEGVVWEGFSEELNVTEEAEYVPGAPVMMGVDDGYTKGHPRVFLLAQVIPPYINVFDSYHALYELPEVSVENVLKMPYPKPSVAYVDSAAAELRGRLWEQNIDTIAATHPVEEGIKHTAAFIKDGKGNVHVRFHPRNSFAIREIQSYVRDEDTQKPLKDNDNVADALRYLLWSQNLQELIDGTIPVQPKRAIVVPEKPAIIESNTGLHDFYKKMWRSTGGLHL